MLSGVYGYFFGEENSNDSVCSQGTPEPCSTSASFEDDWFLVEEECASGRNSPVIIPVPEVRDIDSLSFASIKSWKPPTEEERRRASELKAARAANAARLELEKALFSEVEPSMLSSTSNARIQKGTLASAAKLKRATAAAMVATDAKTKSRSKKAVKTPANRNNNRKCQNLD